MQYLLTTNVINPPTLDVINRTIINVIKLIYKCNTFPVTSESMATSSATNSVISYRGQGPRKSNWGCSSNPLGPEKASLLSVRTFPVI